MSNPYGLGWEKSPYDARDFKPALLAAMVKAGNAEPVAWDVPHILYQDGTPRCGGYSFATLCSASQADAECSPDVGNALGDRIYLRAKELTNDTDMSKGTYLRACAQATKEMGLISAYAFGSWADAEEWLNTIGPVVVGIPWWSSMDNPDAQGVIKAFGGALRGGHAICVAKNNQAPANNGLANTWGTSWGAGGWCYLSDEELQPLVDYQGEVMMAVKFVGVPWKDWGDTDRLAANYVYATGVMKGFPDGTFHPYEPLAYRQVATIADRVGLESPDHWMGMYTPATRGDVKLTFPEFVWNEERWSAPLLRRHMLLLTYRYLVSKGRSV